MSIETLYDNYCNNKKTHPKIYKFVIKTGEVGKIESKDINPWILGRYPIYWNILLNYPEFMN